MRMTLVHGLKGVQCAIGVGAVYLQLRMAQGNRKLCLWLTLQRALKQFVALFVMTQLVGRPRCAQVKQQRLALRFGRTCQMLLRTGPASFGKVHLALFDRYLHTTAAVAARPGINQPG